VVARGAKIPRQVETTDAVTATSIDVPVRRAPQAVEFNRPNTTTERTPTVTLGAEGIYEASLSVTTPYGEDSMNFTLTVGPADSDWMFYIVDAGTGFGKLSLAIIDGRPAIAYTDGYNIKYAISSDPDGSGEWSIRTLAWQISATAMSRLAEVSDGPAILILRQAEGAALAVNESPDGIGEWQLSTIAPQYGASGVIPSLLLVSGRPAVIFPMTDGGGLVVNLHFALNSQADGLGTWSISDIESAPPEERMHFGRYTSATLVGGFPAVAYHSLPLDDYWQRGDLHFAVNSEAGGGGEWSVSTVQTGGDGIVYAQWPSLAEVDGRPAIAYDRWNHSADPMRCYIKYAINTQPDGSGYWNRLTVDTLGMSNSPSLAVVGGRPAIAYGRGTELYGGDWTLAFAENSAVDGTGAWTYHTLDDQSPAGGSPSMVTIDGRPAIAYLRWTGSPGSYEFELMFAIRDY